MANTSSSPASQAPKISPKLALLLRSFGIDINDIASFGKQAADSFSALENKISRIENKLDLLIEKLGA